MSNIISQIEAEQMSREVPKFGAGDDTIIVADGTSCRHQIRDFAERKALHVARVLADALENQADTQIRS